MAKDIFWSLFCFVAPLGVMWLTHHFKVLGRLGDIVVAYVIGCLLGLLQIVGQDTHEALTKVASVAVPFAIPFLLFGSDVRAWRRLAQTFALSTFSCIISCAIAIFVGFKVFGGEDVTSSICGMLLGRYTGGVANQASLKVALGIPDDVYVVCDVCVMALSALYLVIIIVFGRRLSGTILPSFKSSTSIESSAESLQTNRSDVLFYGLFSRPNLPHLLRGLGITIVILIISGLLAKFLTMVVSAVLGDGDYFTPLFILSLTLLSLCASLNARVRTIGSTNYEAGTYFILVFSLAVSMQVSVDVIVGASGSLLGFVTIATLGGLALHILLCALLRVDADTSLVTSISLVCSPPFVPVMAGALGNKQVVAPGIAVGLLGYAVGTYLGFGLAYLLTIIS